MSGNLQRDAHLATPAARRRLTKDVKEHWRHLSPGVHIGLRRGTNFNTWVLRRYIGGKKYATETLGATDDHAPANGASVLDYRQAVARAQVRVGEAHQVAEGISLGYSVSDAMRAYIDHLEAKGAPTAKSMLGSINAHIIPTLGKTRLTDLRAEAIEKWLAKLANAPLRRRTKDGEEQKIIKLDGSPEAVRRRKASANRLLGMLRAGLNLAYQRQKIATDKAWRHVKPFKNVVGRRER